MSVLLDLSFFTINWRKNFDHTRGILEGLSCYSKNEGELAFPSARVMIRIPHISKSGQRKFSAPCVCSL